MGKPFKLVEPVVPRANVARAADGKFQRLEAEPPGKIHDEAKATGETTTDVARSKRVPPHFSTTKPDTTTGDAVHQEENPWPPAGPYNDANRPPMKLKES